VDYFCIGTCNKSGVLCPVWASQRKKDINVVEQVPAESYWDGQVAAQRELQGEAEELDLSLSGMQSI